MKNMTYRLPHKCLKCSLHFMVYSDNPNWADRFAYCPECGRKSCFPMGTEEVEGPIYKHVYAIIPEEVQKQFEQLQLDYEKEV